MSQGEPLVDSVNGKGVSNDQQLADVKRGSGMPSGGDSLEENVRDRFGVLPNFFRMTPANPEITRNLWGFAQFAYLDNPLPALFKERLFVYLSRFCEVRYCIARHVGFLVGLGRPSGDRQAPVHTIEQVVRLLQRPFPRGEELRSFLSVCAAHEKPIRDLPHSDSELEGAIFALACHVFLQTSDAPACLDVLKSLFGERLQYLILFLAFIRTAHYWTKVHPELSFEDDIKELLATQQALAQCILNDAEAQCDGIGKIILDELPGLRQEAHQATSLLAAIVASSDDAIVSKNLDGIISSWNMGAERMFGYTVEEAIGQHITLIIPPDRHAEERDILARLRRGERIDHFQTLRRRKDGTLLDVSVTISPLRDSSGRVIGASKVARDITAQKQSEQALRIAGETMRLMKVQDEERRRIARELHDSAGQTLTVLGLCLARLVERAQVIAPELAEEGEGIEEIVQQLHREIRTTSYLLHPPLLDEVGLKSALSWYVQGVAERSRIAIDLSIADDFGRLPAEMELAIFRVVQECLTNIHRHAESKTAGIRITREKASVCIEVRDEGKGISPERLAEIESRGLGVGIGGIRERLLQFHGKLKIESNGSGTTVFATVPIPREASSTDFEPLQAAV